jgi:hypothetical protein
MSALGLRAEEGGGRGVDEGCVGVGTRDEEEGRGGGKGLRWITELLRRYWTWVFCVGDDERSKSYRALSYSLIVPLFVLYLYKSPSDLDSCAQQTAPHAPSCDSANLASKRPDGHAVKHKRLSRRCSTNNPAIHILPSTYH